MIPPIPGYQPAFTIHRDGEWIPTQTVISPNGRYLCVLSFRDESPRPYRICMHSALDGQQLWKTQVIASQCIPIYRLTFLEDGERLVVGTNHLCQEQERPPAARYSILVFDSDSGAKTEWEQQGLPVGSIGRDTIVLSGAHHISLHSSTGVQLARLENLVVPDAKDCDPIDGPHRIWPLCGGKYFLLSYQKSGGRSESRLCLVDAMTGHHLVTHCFPRPLLIEGIQLCPCSPSASSPWCGAVDGEDGPSGVSESRASPPVPSEETDPPRPMVTQLGQGLPGFYTLHSPLKRPAAPTIAETSFEAASGSRSPPPTSALMRDFGFQAPSSSACKHPLLQDHHMAPEAYFVTVRGGKRQSMGIGEKELVLCFFLRLDQDAENVRFDLISGDIGMGPLSASAPPQTTGAHPLTGFYDELTHVRTAIMTSQLGLVIITQSNSPITLGRQYLRCQEEVLCFPAQGSLMLGADEHHLLYQQKDECTITLMQDTLAELRAEALLTHRACEWALNHSFQQLNMQSQMSHQERDVRGKHHQLLCELFQIVFDNTVLAMKKQSELLRCPSPKLGPLKIRNLALTAPHDSLTEPSPLGCILL